MGYKFLRMYIHSAPWERAHYTLGGLVLCDMTPDLAQCILLWSQVLLPGLSILCNFRVIVLYPISFPFMLSPKMA